MSNDELLAAMKDFAVRCAPIAKLHKIGASVRGFPLHVLEISDKPGVEEAEPHFKYIANMHGTETGGRCGREGRWGAG
jgi:carboxypeptidase D